jgi:hypothetical protein
MMMFFFFDTSYFLFAAAFFKTGAGASPDTISNLFVACGAFLFGKAFY